MANAHLVFSVISGLLVISLGSTLAQLGQAGWNLIAVGLLLCVVAIAARLKRPDTALAVQLDPAETITEPLTRSVS